MPGSPSAYLWSTGNTLPPPSDITGKDGINLGRPGSFSLAHFVNLLTGTVASPGSCLSYACELTNWASVGPFTIRPASVSDQGD